jgi:hypothetical protein
MPCDNVSTKTTQLEILKSDEAILRSVFHELSLNIRNSDQKIASAIPQMINTPTKEEEINKNVHVETASVWKTHNDDSDRLSQQSRITIRRPNSNVPKRPISRLI